MGPRSPEVRGRFASERSPVKAPPHEGVVLVGGPGFGPGYPDCPGGSGKSGRPCTEAVLKASRAVGRGASGTDSCRSLASTRPGTHHRSQVPNGDKPDPTVPGAKELRTASPGKSPRRESTCARGG